MTDTDLKAALVPELDVTDLRASLVFYVDLLGFQVLFERQVEGFSYLALGGAELMRFPVRNRTPAQQPSRNQSSGAGASSVHNQPVTAGRPHNNKATTALPDRPELREVLSEAQMQGYIGGGDLETAIAHATGFALAASEAPGRYLDLGSGGGLPGLALAYVWPEAEAVLLDGGERRADFLTWAVEQLDLNGRVAVRRARAEAAAHDPGLRGSFDLVTARGFAPPAVTAECAAPMLHPGGELVVSEPPARSESDSDRSSRWPPEGVAQLGLALGRAVADPFHYQVLIQESLCPERYPRRTGVPSKRPLF